MVAQGLIPLQHKIVIHIQVSTAVAAAPCQSVPYSIHINIV
jgi:hypothetical protein